MTALLQGILNNWWIMAIVGFVIGLFLWIGTAQGWF